MGVVTRGRFWFLALAVLCCACTTGDNRPSINRRHINQHDHYPGARDHRCVGRVVVPPWRCSADLPVKGRAPKTGYTRDQFGPAVAGRGPQRLRHPQRHPAPRPDGDRRPRQPPRAVWRRTGTLHDPYTAAASTSSLREGLIDRGADRPRGGLGATPGRPGPSRWTRLDRRRFANDPLNLLAVDGPPQHAEGATVTPRRWLPPNKAYRCAYVARQVAVKVDLRPVGHLGGARRHRRCPRHMP